jgi:hypothetical protein
VGSGVNVDDLAAKMAEAGLASGSFSAAPEESAEAARETAVSTISLEAQASNPQE